MSSDGARAIRRVRRRIATTVRENQWALPLLGAIVGAALGLLLFDVGRTPRDDWAISVSQARATLATLVALMFTILSLSLSLTTLALDNVASHFSIRMLAVAANDYRTKVATSVFAMAVSFIGIELFKLTDFASDALTPRAPFIIAVSLIICSGIALFWQLNYTIQSLRLDRSLARLQRVINRAAGRDHRRSRGWIAATRPERTELAVPLIAATLGYVGELDLSALGGDAADAEVCVVIDRPVGAPVVGGEELGWAQRAGASEITPDTLEDIRSSVQVGPGPEAAGDVGFGIRILVDIASLALSPAVNDPYTAVQVVEMLTIVSAGLAGYELGPRALTTDDDVVAWYAAPTLAEHLESATEPIARYGAAEPLVLAALERLRQEVERTASSEGGRGVPSGREGLLLSQTGAAAGESAGGVEP